MFRGQKKRTAPWKRPVLRGLKGGEPSGARVYLGCLGGLGGGLGLQRVLGFGDQAGKGDLVADGEVGQDLAVELDVGGVQTLDEAAVADAVGARGGVQTNDPDGAEVALLLAAGTEGVEPGVMDGFFRVAEELGFVTEVTFGVTEDLLPAFAGSGGICGTRHVGLFFFFGPEGRLVRITHLAVFV